jgi:hypothetical protein
MVKKADIKKWKELAVKELRGEPPESLNWKTPEGIVVKPLYTAADLRGLQQIKMPVFPLPESPMTFIADVWPQGRRAYRWLLIWPPTEDTTPIIRGCPVILERPEWQWIPLKT